MMFDLPEDMDEEDCGAVEEESPLSSDCDWENNVEDSNGDELPPEFLSEINICDDSTLPDAPDEKANEPAPIAGAGESKSEGEVKGAAGESKSEGEVKGAAGESKNEAEKKGGKSAAEVEGDRLREVLNQIRNAFAETRDDAVANGMRGVGAELASKGMLASLSESSATDGAEDNGANNHSGKDSKSGKHSGKDSESGKHSSHILENGLQAILKGAANEASKIEGALQKLGKSLHLEIPKPRPGK